MKMMLYQSQSTISTIYKICCIYSNIEFQSSSTGCKTLLGSFIVGKLCVKLSFNCNCIDFHVYILFEL